MKNYCINFQSRIALLFAISMSLMVSLRYLNLHSNIYDLGIYLNTLYNTPNNWKLIFYGHFQPLLIPYAVLYKVLPIEISPVILLLSQTSFILISIWAVWFFVGMWAGIALILYIPLWQIALFDFHFDHLAIPLLVIFFIATNKNKFSLATIAALSLMLIKETFALQTVFCGVYFWWLAYSFHYKYRSYYLIILGSLLILVGIFWFYSTTQWLIPYFSGAGSNFGLSSHSFSWLGNSPLEVIITLLKSPSILFNEFMTFPPKVILLAVIFGSLGFISLLRPSALIVAAPMILIPLLSHSKEHFDYANHYSAGIIIPVIIAFNDGLLVAIKLFKQYLSLNEDIFFALLFILMIFSHWYLSPSPISRIFWSQKIWSYSWEAYAPVNRSAMIKDALLKHIPKDSNISISSQNNINLSYLANRKYYFSFPLGVESPQTMIDFSNRDLIGLWNFILRKHTVLDLTNVQFADYVVIDLKRPLFIIDKGCEWVYGECRNKEIEFQFLRWVSYCDQYYESIFNIDGFRIYKRRPL